MYSGCGSQYHSNGYRSMLRRLDARQSIIRTGSCLDGAAAEPFFTTLEAEIGVDSWPERNLAYFAGRHNRSAR